MTDLPFGEPQIHLSTAFGLEPDVFFERTTNHAGRDSEVAVVAGSSQPKASARGQLTNVRPAAFQEAAEDMLNEAHGGFVV